MKRLIATTLLCLGTFAGFSQDNVIISEFMASNTKTVADEDGDFPDWIEIYNAGTNTVNLNGWYLADRNNQWQFPATNLPPKSFMLVFASNKNRRIPGRPLHTNFRLDADPPEVVSLLRPNQSVASRITPPVQVADISYGVGVSQTPATLVTTGASARLLVPPNDSLGLSWVTPEFSDTSWTAVNNGIGFEGTAANTSAAAVIANSVADFRDTQGSNNWVYGYWDKGTDPDGNYDALIEFIPFPRGTGNTLNSTNYWNGTSWKWPPPSDPPWTEITATGGHPTAPNGGPSGATHWVVRRYISQSSGQVRLSGILACSSLSGTCGDGVIGRIYVDGVQVFQRTAFGESRVYSLVVNVAGGSYIDFVIDPGAEDNDFCDTTTFTAIIRGAGDTALVADTVEDWSDTGEQGYKGWTYGAFIKTNTAAVYSPGRFGAFPSAPGPHGVNNFWNGEMWQWFDGDPPFDRIGRITSMPNIFPSTSTTNAQEHWVIRRWVSEIAGTLHIDWHLAKKDLTGNGATARVLRNGNPVGTQITIGGADFVGSNRADVIANVQVGDVIDFTVEPGGDIVGDECFFSAVVHGVTTLSNQFNTDVSSAMANVNATAYLRIPFTVTDASALNTLALRVKYDDGFHAYINGHLVASRNAPEPPNWDSRATASRIDAASSQYEEFNLTTAVGDSIIRSGQNVLAIHGLNSTNSDPDFLIVAQLLGTIGVIDTNNVNYFYTPTPGAPNGFGSSVLGPLIVDVSHTPHEPNDDEDLFVRARIIPVRDEVTTVRLYYRVMFGAEANVVMEDDGLHWDGAAGDGIYGGTIPNGLSGIGQMVRYYITATDSGGGTTREPLFAHPTFSSQYYGAVVKNVSLTNPLEVLHLFITEANLNSANGSRTVRAPCSLYFLGEFYDNLGINLHGQSSSGFPKRSYDIDFNADHNFMWSTNERRVDDINLLTTYPDKAHMRNIIGYETFRNAGSPNHFVVPVRVQTNGGFYGTWHLMENGDENFLRRNGRDPRGALYKMYNTFTAIGNTTIGTDPNAEKKTRREEGNADLVALFVGISTNNLNVRTNYMYDNMNISEVINKTAARNLIADIDCCHKNYYFYKDSEGTGEWEAMPWDIDLSFGRNWQGADNPSTPAAGDGCSCYWDTNIWYQNYVLVGQNNSFWQALFNFAPTREMYYRRLRTLMDEQLQPPGTPANQLLYEARVNELASQIGPDGQLDLLKWGTWGQGTAGPIPTSDVLNYQNVYQAAAVLNTNFFPNRRLALYNRTAGNSAEIPTNAQPTNIVILIGSMDFNPSSGNQAEEYVQLVNTNNVAVDISGWRLAGAIEHTFQGGVVLPRNGSLYVVPDKNAFRNRATPPRRGMGLYVEGPYSGQLSARGETIYLTNKHGHLIRTNQYNGNPTPAQNALRVTEIMYHPTAQPGDIFPVEEYEYIELRNIGGIPLNLTGVHFVRGIEFTFGSVPLLAPGEYVLIVKNIAAFESRYGPGFNIAGQYIGSLDNGGENIEIADIVGEKVQDFAYNNSWYPITDGAGASLVIVNDQAHWDSWGLKESWRPSTYDGGTPGAGDAPLVIVAPVLVNEVLTHSDFPVLDQIELRNTNTAAVNISGWFISDDFEEPKKFRIPDGTIIPAGEYVTFDEDDFNPSPGVPPSFSFSSLGDEAYLFSGDGTNITGYFHGFEYGPAETGISFIRYVDSATNEHFVASSANTLGGANAYPRVGPVVISEIMYNPAPYADGTDNSWEEFIEIHNLSSNAVPLYDINEPANIWRVRGGVDIDFPPGQSLAAGAFALLVSFDTTNTPVLNQFRDLYNLSPSIAIYGPYEGRLNNAGDSVRLLKPDAPVLDDLGNTVVPYVIVDQVDYLPVEPWPLAADGLGASLQRKVFANFGNDPANWAGGISPGTIPGDTPPSITSLSSDQTTIEGHTLILNVTATGSPPLIYRWRFNSNNIAGGGGGSLVIPNITPNQAGWYNAVIFNSAGSVESTYIHVTVLFAPHFLRQPQSTNAPLGSNVTFSVVAESENTGTNLLYQWYFRNSLGQDSPISGATNPAYTLLSAQLADMGHYFVAVSDPVDTVMSDLARLTVLVPPFFTQLPISQYVPQGGSVTVSMAVTNTATLPLTNRWRRIGGGGQTNFNVFATTDYLTVTNVQGSNRYDVIVFNQARPQGFQSPIFFIAALPDADQDGLPDQWEIDNGLSDPTGDADGDTMSNLAEFIAGTDPQNGQSYLKVENLTLGGGAAIEFMALSNKTYTVESTDSLESGLWTRVRDVYATSNSGPVTVIDPTFTINRFYRLATPRKR
jgi:hypothetical protein